METLDWMKIGFFVSMVLGFALVYGNVVGIGVLFLIIAVILWVMVYRKGGFKKFWSQ